MTSINEITGDKIQTKGATTDAYRDSWDRVFGKKKEPCPCEVGSAGCCATEIKVESEKKKHSGCCGECC